MDVFGFYIKNLHYLTLGVSFQLPTTDVFHIYKTKEGLALLLLKHHSIAKCDYRLHTDI